MLPKPGQPTPVPDTVTLAAQLRDAEAGSTQALVDSTSANEPPDKGPEPAKATTAPTEEYEEAPDFTLKNVTGESFTLSALLPNGPVYMECWDLPCVNCIAELDALMPVYDSLKDRGLQIIALSVDKPADEARVKAFVKSKKWPYICLLDQQNDVKSAYGIAIKPTAYLINTEGKIVYTHIGYKKGDEKRIEAEFLKRLPEEQVEQDTSATGKSGE